MLRKMLERRVGQFSNTEFKEIMEATTDDIKFNKIGFNRRTSLIEMLDIAERCAIAFKKCA